MTLLPAIMAECFVSICHFVVSSRFFTAEPRPHCIGQLTGKALFHCVLLRPLGGDQPTNSRASRRSTRTSTGTGGCTTNTAGAPQRKASRSQELRGKPSIGAFLQLVFDAVRRCKQSPAADFAIDHQVVHEFCQNLIAILGVRQDSRFQRRDDGTSSSPYGRLAPYFERRCLRSLTPWVSEHRGEW